MYENYPSMGKQTSRSKKSQKLPEKVNLKRPILKHTVELLHSHKNFTPDVKIFQLEIESGSSLRIDTIKCEESLALFPQCLGS